MAQEEFSAAFSDLAVDDLDFSALFDEENQEDDLAVGDLCLSALFDEENQEDDLDFSALFDEENQEDNLAVGDLCLSALLDEENQEDGLAVDDLCLSALLDEENQEDALAVDDLCFSALFDKENQEDDLAVDDLYFSALFDKENQEDIVPVSDEMYAEELQFQEEVTAFSSQMAKSASPSSSLSSPPSLTIQACLGPQSEPIEVTVKAGDSSLSFCEICCERKEKDQMFKIESCIHSFCSDCISKHVASKIQGGVISRVTCPGLDCKSVLEYDACRPVLPEAVLELWGEALCQELIDASQRFYCPFKDCAAMLVYENDGETVISESECPFCHRLFCAQCYVPWHPGVNCEEYQRLNVDERGREDLMVRELAKEKKWSRCPHCKYYVERTEGCPHMTCRCQFQFCYGCEAQWTQNHGGCSRK